jgi:hypothetical protein
MLGTCDGGSHVLCVFLLSLSSCSTTRAVLALPHEPFVSYHSACSITGARRSFSRLSPPHELAAIGIDDPRALSFWIGMGRYRERSVREREGRMRKGEKIATWHGSHLHMYLACWPSTTSCEYHLPKESMEKINRLIVEGQKINIFELRDLIYPVAATSCENHPPKQSRAKNNRIR